MKKTLAAFAFAMAVTAGLTWAGGAIGLSSPPSSAQVTAITVIADGGTFDTVNTRVETVSSTLTASGNILMTAGQFIILDNGGFTSEIRSNSGIETLGSVHPATDTNDSVGTALKRYSAVFVSGAMEADVSKGTAASGTGITANYTSNVRTFVHKVTVINTALAAAATSDVTLHITPVNTRINRVTADVTQVFTGGALSAVTVTCGKTAGGNEYLLSGSVFTAQTTLGDVVAEMGAGLVDATRADMGTPAAGVPGAITVQCRFTCTGANCSAATQGSVTFLVEGVTY